MDRAFLSDYKTASKQVFLIDFLIRPYLKTLESAITSGNDEIYEGFEYFFNEISRSSPGCLKSLNNFVLRAFKSVHDLIEYSIVQNYKADFVILDLMDQNLVQELERLESVLDKHPSTGELDFAFSYKNKKVLQKLLTEFGHNLEIANQIPKIKKLQYGLAYYIIQNNARLSEWEIPYKEPQFDEETRMKRLAYFVKYAVGIYGPDDLYNSTIEKQKKLLFLKGTDREQFMFWSNTSEEEMIEGFFENKQYLPVHAVCLDKASKSVVVSIRGTSSLEDIITDLHATYEPYEVAWGSKTYKGNVHQGMMHSARNISEKIKPAVLHALDKNPEYTLVINGHSLGAGTSAMLGLLWMTELHIIERKMEVYCYSPPATNSIAMNEILSDFVLSCSFGHDVVAKASLGTLSDLAEMLVFMDKAEDANKVHSSSLLTNYLSSYELGTQENLSIYKELKQWLKVGYFERLVPPGVMFQIFKKDYHEEFGHAAKHPRSKFLEDTIAGVFIDPQYHQEIILSPTLASDHSCINLQYTLQKMWGITHVLDYNDPSDAEIKSADKK